MDGLVGRAKLVLLTYLALLGLKAELSWLTTEHTLGLSSTAVSEWDFLQAADFPTVLLSQKNLEEAACMFIQFLEANIELFLPYSVG